MKVVGKATTTEKEQTGKVLKVVQAKKTAPKPDPIESGFSKLSKQIGAFLAKDAPAPVVTVNPPAVTVKPPNVTVKPVAVTVQTPEIVMPDPPKRWEFTATKTGNVWKIIAERI